MNGPLRMIDDWLIDRFFQNLVNTYYRFTRRNNFGLAAFLFGVVGLSYGGLLFYKSENGITIGAIQYALPVVALVLSVLALGSERKYSAESGTESPYRFDPLYFILRLVSIPGIVDQLWLSLSEGGLLNGLQFTARCAFWFGLYIEACSSIPAPTKEPPRVPKSS